MQQKIKGGVATNHDPNNDLNLKDTCKVKQTADQYSQTFAEYFKQPQTMKMVSVKTGIDRANICRYNRTLRKSNLVAIFKVGRCPITRHRANFYTTNPQLFPVNLQGKLF